MSRIADDPSCWWILVFARATCQRLRAQPVISFTDFARRSHTYMWAILRAPWLFL